MTTMRLLSLGNAWFPEKPGGLDRFYMELMRAFPSVGVESKGLVVGTEAVAGQTDGRITAFAAANAPLPHRLLAARRATSALCDTMRPDLIAAHFALYAFPSLTRLRQRPFVFHFQGPWAAEGIVEGQRPMAARVQAAIERAVYRRADRVIVLSRAFGDEVVRRYDVDPARVRVIPGGVNTAAFDNLPSRADARATLGWPADRPLLLCVRRLQRRMGLEDLLDAVAAIRHRHADLQVMIAGRGPLRDALQGRIDALGLGANVRLLGFLPDAQLPLAYRAADLSVVPTVALEGFGLITLESLAAGTPVLVTPVGGLPEAVAGLAADMILPASGPQALAAGLDAALRGELALPDAQHCRDHVEQHHRWDSIAAKVRDVYAQAMEARG